MIVTLRFILHFRGTKKKKTLKSTWGILWYGNYTPAATDDAAGVGIAAATTTRMHADSIAFVAHLLMKHANRKSSGTIIISQYAKAENSFDLIAVMTLETNCITRHFTLLKMDLCVTCTFAKWKLSAQMSMHT